MTLEPILRSARTSRGQYDRGVRKPPLASAALFAGVGRVGIPWEEHLLGAKFGDAYHAYADRVPRWL
jgi:hypothetical protein